jgi:hypothetical protein
MPVDLTGQVVLISGAGGGLGRSAARYLARCGAVVGVNDIDAARCEDTCALITRAGGVAHSLAADLSSREAFLGVAATLAKTAGRIDMPMESGMTIREAGLNEERLAHLRRTIESPRYRATGFDRAARHARHGGRPAGGPANAIRRAGFPRQLPDQPSGAHDPELDLTFVCLSAGVMESNDNIERFQRLSDIAVGAAL